MQSMFCAAFLTLFFSESAEGEEGGDEEGRDDDEYSSPVRASSVSTGRQPSAITIQDPSFRCVLFLFFLSFFLL